MMFIHVTMNKTNHSTVLDFINLLQIIKSASLRLIHTRVLTNGHHILLNPSCPLLNSVDPDQLASEKVI